ncbi:ATP-binding protein [Geminicoccus roseus]|uniref:ATP-binding protein n=1 Tax=Geminicoccus roseus TaxID=404900 RepID=UPI00042976C8|nr:ATP-binding protein [Geminicoccus roseus]
MLPESLKHWLAPANLTTRLVLLAVSVVALVIALAAAWTFWERADTARRFVRLATIDRMAATQLLVDRLPPSELGIALRAISGPLLLVRLLDEPRGRPTDDPRLDRHLARLMARHPSGVFLGREMVLRQVDREGPRDGGEGPPDLLPSFARYEVGIRQNDGTWLIFTVPADTLSRFWLGRAILIVLAVVGGAALIAWLLFRRITRPVTALAVASDRFAAGLPAEPLRESGPPEIRRATAAFNRMRQRIGELLAERNSMLAAIAHDLRTPLTRLHLRLEDLPDDQARSRAKNDVQAMETMLRETLAYAKDVAGVEQATDLDFAALVRTAVDDLSDAGREAQYEGPDRLVLRGRPTALRRAVDNLLANAVTYGTCAEVTLAADPRQVRMTIADRGPGIPLEMRERVFEPFFRLETSRSRSTGGTGLGLALARGIVRAHGGEVSLRDREGGGTLVEVTLAR